jgi:DNA polymerase-3 subunit delta'
MIWDKIHGHDELVRRFRRSVARGRLSHAYLFVGPDGVGKKLFARSLAQCLLCERFRESELEACGECSSCRQMTAGSHPDSIEVGCPEGKSELPIEAFVGPRERRGREGLCHDLSLRPMASRHKIAVIDDAHLMNAESANALLKTLEEPPDYVVLVLIANSRQALLPTIRSRCQEVRFEPLAADEVAKLLVELGLAGDSVEASARAALSGGSLAQAARLGGSTLSAIRENVFKTLAAGVARPLDAAAWVLAGLDELGGEPPLQRDSAAAVVEFIIEFYRGALRRLSGANEAVCDPQIDQYIETLRQWQGDLAAEATAAAVERAAAAAGHLERRTPAALCFETLFDDLSRIHRERQPAS